ncbi:hypothetical protein LLG96_07395 [bacterium]|nr:hypothetical protein [bacterium]
MNRVQKVIGLCMLGACVAVISAFAELYNRAPDVLPGTTPEMKTTEYWIARMKNPDEVILTPEAIEGMNMAYEERMRSADPFKGIAKERLYELSYWWPGHVYTVTDFSKISPSAVADTVRSRIAIQIEYLHKQDYGNNLAVKYADWELKKFEDEMALDNVPKNIKIRNGIAVRNTQLRNIPSFFPGSMGITDSGKTKWEMWTIGIVKICSPVTVFYPSKSGEFLLILCTEGYGWARAEDIAFGPADQVEEFSNPKNFIVCTGDRIQFYSDPTCIYSSGWLRMGDRLPVTMGKQIRVPVRSMDGSLTSANCYLRPDADVHQGWLPYTRRNIVVTAFKLLDNSYDWTGAWFGRQHENTYRDIFSVFGFRLPWHGGLFSIYGHNETVLMPDIGKEEQYRGILKNEPFVTLQSCGGHAQLLLGEYNGVPIVFDQHGYGYKDENGTMLEVRRCCIGDMRMPDYFLKRKVTFCGLK